jgi:hypothetical protein
MHGGKLYPGAAPYRNNVAGRFRTLSFLIEPAQDQQLEFSDGSLSVISYPRYHQLCPFSGGQRPKSKLRLPDIRGRDGYRAEVSHIALTIRHLP